MSYCLDIGIRNALRDFGMKSVLETIISQIDPKEEYEHKLVLDLKKALSNYNNRYNTHE